MIGMLKAKFIDKILEVMGDEAERIYIDKKEVSVYFKNSRDVEGNAEILKHIYTLQLNKVVEDYRVSIDYELKTIEIHRGTNFVCLRNFNSCNGKIWTVILEDLEKEIARSESMIKIANVIISNGDLALRAAKFKDDMMNADNKLPKMLEG